MDENRRAASRTVLEEREEVGRIEIELDDSVASLAAAMGVHVRANLDSVHAELVDGAVELAARKFRVLQRHGREPREARGMRANDAGNVVVEVPRKLERGVRGLVVTKHHGHRGEHLHVDPVLGALAEARGGVPAVRLDVAEVPSVDREPCAVTAGGAPPEVLDREPAARPRLLGEVGPRRRKDVGMQVDGAHGAL